MFFLFVFFFFLFVLAKNLRFRASFFEKKFLFSFFFAKILRYRAAIFERILRARPHVSPRWGEPLSDKRRSLVPEAPCIGRV